MEDRPKKRHDALRQRVAKAAIILFGAACASTPEQLTDGVKQWAPVVQEHEFSLTQVLQDDLSGFRRMESPDSQVRWLNFAEEMINANKTRSGRRECLRGQRDENRICQILHEAREQEWMERNTASIEKKSRRGKSIRALAQSAMKGDLAAFEGATENQCAGAFRRVHRLASLQKFVKAIRERESCLSSSLLTSVGLKMEEGFPEESAKQAAIEFYERSAKCASAPNDLSAIKAQYRLGLIHIWDNKWKEADEVLAKSLEAEDVRDFRSRALYWRHIANKQMGENGDAEDLREQLIREFPLSLHSLLVRRGTAVTDLSKVKKREFEVRFRTEKKPELNTVVAAAEALQALEAYRQSAEVLWTLIDENGGPLKGTEQAFQLYVAVLLNRSGAMVPKFQLLANMIRESPELLCESVLQLLYPVRRFEVVKSYESMIDPYLAMSLIRQESAFNETARSPAGALGLMQLMPRTARRFERVGRHHLLNPATNIRIGVKLFSKLMGRFEGKPELALAAYNAGPLRVDDWMKRYPIENRLLFVDLIPFRETREYIASIARNYYWYLRLYDEQRAANTIQDFLFFSLFSAVKTSESAPFTAAPAYFAENQ